ncbi:nitronate monooxygenase family protein [Actimicrobium sp. CCC2.4]|uniref:NAD(P)H-dependent flavin oxidoreductase n=1 Tax=Actimicrobium sp. CCC2.4 TaxID=3048606 RepID=UPI002AC9D000|nr:nitronate monooxygenase family protein [Actimicrobium sp. CCC2.4]MEB0134786.1 nitronate monooxygenase family protein [Actimicrobium sp. CCC2.4]WPX30724.1 nitronate monooxygenase family protein [Actimicrobium sp. CCC2.4]
MLQLPSRPLPRFILKGKSLLPIVQGGMGVGISAHRLAGTVASLGAIGTISSVDLRRRHADLMAQTGKSRDKELINSVNLIALDREITAARAIAGGNGMVAVNTMRAVAEYAAQVRQSCESGAEAIVVGAGLPLDLPELTAGYPDVALIPILSDTRGIALVIKKWMRKNRLPDAIVIESPRYAGGHLGAMSIEGVDDPHFAFPTVLEGKLELFRQLGIERENIPLIVAGGIHTHQQISALLALGASAAQLGSPFAVTEEGDAHSNFKKVLVEAGPDDIVTFMSVAGLPARAVLTPWLINYLEKESKLMAKAGPKACTVGFDCLQQCGLRDGNGKAGQFCIDTQLAFAMNGDMKRGLFFRGSESLPFGREIRPVRELMDYLLTGVRQQLWQAIVA